MNEEQYRELRETIRRKYMDCVCDIVTGENCGKCKEMIREHNWIVNKQGEMYREQLAHRTANLYPVMLSWDVCVGVDYGGIIYLNYNLGVPTYKPSVG